MKAKVGQTVRIRYMNEGMMIHPMHLHGFYFTVDSLGNGVRDSIFQKLLERGFYTNRPDRVRMFFLAGAVLAYISLGLNDDDRAVRGARAAKMPAYRWSERRDFGYLRAALGLASRP